MLFNSYAFLFGYLPVVLLGYFGLSRLRLTRAALAWLVAASLFFYAYWDIRYLPLLLGSILFNFTLGKLIEHRPRRSLLAIGIVGDLALLAYYKYAHFFTASANAVFHAQWPLPEIILPLGISFFTFTQIAYLVDAYRGETKRHNLVTYSLFVTVFPHLIAGPILHHRHMLPQFQRLRNFVFSSRNFALGLALLAMGLFKKVAVADNLAPWVRPVFDHAAEVTFLEAWTGALAYTFQLYFDFSGYSDMAIGLGLMFNLRLPINFNSPYKSASIIDFWRRWHISLSSFLRDYLYIPLGGSRKGEARRLTNLVLTMVLGGLWHGAGWTFVAWGGLHGAYLVMNHTWRKLGLTLPGAVGWSLTFVAVVVGWVFFRAATIADAWQLVLAMSGAKGVVLPLAYQPALAGLSGLGVRFEDLAYWSMGKEGLLALAGLTLVTAFAPNSQELLSRFRPSWWMGLLAGGLMLYVLTNLEKVSEFLYFQF